MLASRVFRRVTAYLGLGSNLGDREAHLRRAVELLKPRRVSSLYESEPMYVTDQPRFLNIVAELRTDLGPEELFRRCEEIEAALGGRERPIPKGPRTIDIDLLLYDDVVMQSKDLTLPHPAIAERLFVLEPLAELAPGITIPGSGVTLQELLNSLSGQDVRRLGPFPTRAASP
jgi:2-amino-4-hydroxy-6-hydroxymethyldihydropteridine diphosphokinase